VSAAEQDPGDERLAHARRLVAALEAGDETRTAEALAALGAAADATLFRELGRTARRVHDELVACTSDPELLRLAESDAPDARVRLDHVIELTEQAAHRTLDAVERAQPLARAIAAESDDEPAAALERARGHAAEIDAALTDVLLAQDFQDRTGQLIRRAIHLVENVELRLVALLRCAGQLPGAGAVVAAAGGTAHGFGPRVADAGDEGLSSQEQVDDLLESLGF
jgi:chemotaxis protein CheZ